MVLTMSFLFDMPLWKPLKYLAQFSNKAGVFALRRSWIRSSLIMMYLENFHSWCREYRAIALRFINSWWSNTSHHCCLSTGFELLSLENTDKGIDSSLRFNFLSNLCCWEFKLNNGIPSLLATPLSLLNLTVLPCPSSLVHDSSDCELSLRRIFNIR